VILGFEVISVKQMTATRRTTPEETTTANLPLFLFILPRAAKFQDLFRLTSLCHIAIRVEAYKAQNGLTQCYNFQQFVHFRANCKQFPSLFVVSLLPSAQGAPGEGKGFINTGMLQLPVGGRRESSPFQLPELQPRE
jgi:hypothetical protein